MFFREGAVLRDRSYFFCQSHRPDILMATLAPCFSLKKCPPMPAHGLAAPEPAFGNRYKQPVSVEFHADGEVTATGFSFEEYAFAQTRIRKLHGERRLPTPSWAFDYAQQRELLARFWEMRAGILHPRIDTPEKRLRYAYRRYMRKYVPKFRETLHELCHEFVACQDPKRRRQLEIEIQGTDTQLRTAEQGPALIVGIIHHYYAVGLDSVGTGAELGVRPVSVRQTLNRLHKMHRAMVDGTDRKPTPEEVRRAQRNEYWRRWKEENPEKARKHLARTKEWRDAHREEFRAQCRQWTKKNRDYRRSEHKKCVDPVKIRERVRKWAEANRERVRENQRRWRLAHPEREKVYERRRRAKKKALAGTSGPTINCGHDATLRSRDAIA